MALVDLLDAFASNEPVPGGGSAAALAGALGASLLIMVAGLPKTRTGAPEEAADLAEASARLRPLRDSLLELVDDDSRAYAAVLDARRLPKATDAERDRRRAAIEAAMHGATRVPLETMRFCQQALRGALVVARHGNPNAATDAGAAVELLVAALRSAAMNVDVNVKSVSDGSFAERVAAERAELASEGEADAARARARLATA
ncbi:MAG: cyclodeaminase/cyclohydrolase family protein [Acidobacteria bacterium]|nr:cyclodeaminase/cyclohydrolase family protein [Acidobacteriota bacterium]